MLTRSRRPQRLRATLRLLCSTLACLDLCAAALGQARAPRSDANAPKRVDSSPFRRIDIGDLRIELMALNDEACPLQLQSGRVSPAAGRHHALWVDVKSLAASPLGSFSLITLVFDATGRLKGTRDTSGGPSLAPHKRASVELTLDYSGLATGDWLVVAVGRVTWDGSGWQSDTEELISVAREHLSRRL